MLAFPPQLQHILISLVQRQVSDDQGTGRFTLSHEGLARVWDILMAKGNAPSWLRFSEFCSKTAVKFQVQERGDDAAAGVAAEVRYHVEVLCPLFFDTTGVCIQPLEILSFLRRSNMTSMEGAVSSSSSDMSGVCTRSASSDSHGIVTGSDASEGRRHRPDDSDELMARSKRLRLQHGIMLKMNEVAAETEGDARSECSRSSSTDLCTQEEVRELLRMLRLKDDACQQLRADKRRLQQCLRRATAKIKKIEHEHEAKQKEQESNSFVIDRCNKAWEGKKKWSWLTPMGHANLAVPC